jgi:hypothetical protein
MESVCQSINKWHIWYPGWQVVFISYNDGKKYSDDDICRRAARLVKGSVAYTWQTDVIKYIETVSSFRVFVGMRYHSLVFAYMTGTPFVAIESYPRCGSFSRFIHNPVSPIRMKSILEGKLLQSLYLLSDNTMNTTRNWMPITEAKALARKGIIC